MTLICVTGTRHATIADHGLTVQRAILDTIPADDTGPHHIYVGDAAGVDLIVRTLFGGLGNWHIHQFEARWDECAADCPPGTDDNPHRRPYKTGRGDYCPLAGRRRNIIMVKSFAEAGGKLVLAFPGANVRSSGTRGCVREATRAGLAVTSVPLVVQVPAKRQPGTSTGTAT